MPREANGTRFAYAGIDLGIVTAVRQSERPAAGPEGVPAWREYVIIVTTPEERDAN